MFTRTVTAEDYLQRGRTPPKRRREEFTIEVLRDGGLRDTQLADFCAAHHSAVERLCERAREIGRAIGKVAGSAVVVVANKGNAA